MSVVALPSPPSKLAGKLSLIADRVRGVAGGYTPGAFITGRPGTGKTTVVRRTLDQLRARSVEKNGRMSPAALFNLLHDYPDQVLVIDDVPTLLQNKQARQILMPATAPTSDGRRTIHWEVIRGETYGRVFRRADPHFQRAAWAGSDLPCPGGSARPRIARADGRGGGGVHARHDGEISQRSRDPRLGDRRGESGGTATHAEARCASVRRPSAARGRPRRERLACPLSKQPRATGSHRDRNAGRTESSGTQRCLAGARAARQRLAGGLHRDRPEQVKVLPAAL